MKRFMKLLLWKLTAMKWELWGWLRRKHDEGSVLTFRFRVIFFLLFPIDGIKTRIRLATAPGVSYNPMKNVLIIGKVEFSLEVLHSMAYSIKEETFLVAKCYEEGIVLVRKMNKNELAKET